MITSGSKFPGVATPAPERGNKLKSWLLSGASGWAVSVFILALAIRWLRITAGPDIFSDELEYTSIARHLGATGHLDDFLGAKNLGPFFTHPPLYFALAALFQKITENADLRYMCGLIGAITAVQLFYLGRSIRDTRTGLIAGLYFAFSPLSVRIDRMAMIEALATALTVAFVQVLWRGATGRRWVLAGGTTLGLLFITKELLLFMVPVMLLCYLLYSRTLTLQKVVAVIALGIAFWAVYALCSTLIDASLFWSTKTESIQRLLGQKVTTGYSLPRYPSPFGDIERRAWEIFPDIAAGVVALIGCLRRVLVKDDRGPERLALIWLVCVGGFLLAGRIYNFQFVVYLVPPAALGSALVLGSLSRGHGAYSMRLLRFWVAVLLVIGGIVSTIYRYGFTTDMAQTQAADWINGHVPPGTLLYAPQEFSWLTPRDHDVNPYYNSSLQSTRKLNLHWVVISPRTSYMLDPATLAWVSKHGRVVERYYGVTLREVDVIYLPTALGH